MILILNIRKDLIIMENIKRFTSFFEDYNDELIEHLDGAGRDTIFLIKNNWNVIAIDREDTKDIIEISLNAEELKKFKFVQQNFENIQLDKNDLIVSNFSIPFCNKNHFNDFWLKIVNSINSNRILCR